MREHKSPSKNGNNGGRDASTGRFTPGNPGGPGNPYARATAAFRSVMLETITEADIKAVVKILIKSARSGESWAIRELLDRTIGKATQAVEVSGPDARPLTLEEIVKATQTIIGQDDDD